MATVFRGPLVVTPRSDRLSTYPVSLRTIALSSSLLLLTAAVPSPTVARLTELAPIAKHYPVTLRSWTQNLQQTTLFSAPLTPPIGNRHTDLAPIAAPYPIDLRTALVSLQTTTFFAAPSPIQVQLPSLTQAAPYPIDLRTTANGPGLPLTVSPAQLNARGVSDPLIRTTEYPGDLRTMARGLLGTPLAGTPQNYLLRIPNVAPQPLNPYPVAFRTWSQNLLETTLAQPITFPHGGFDCSVNWATTFPANLRTSIFYFVLDDNVPPQPSDVATQTPRARSYPDSLRTWTQNGVRLLSVPSPVGVLRVTELPIAAVYPSMLRTWTVSLLQTTLLPQVFTPIGAAFTELPRTGPYGIDLRSTTLNLQETTLAPPFGGRPTAQYHWPTIPGAYYPPSLRTWLHGRDFLLKDTFFGGPGQPPTLHDWPTIPGAYYPDSLRFWAQSSITIQPTTFSIWWAVYNRYVNPDGDGSA